MSAKEKTSGFMAEFKQFIARGNVMDMAVGVIVGGAFKAIADSLTQDILMPFIGIFVGEDTFADLMLEFGGAEIKYGSFLQSVLNFIIMAFVVFCLIKALNRFHHKKEEAPAAPPAPPEPSNEEKLLTEIRDLLKKEN